MGGIKMIGYSNTEKDIAIGVDYMPERKKPCLVMKEGNIYTKLASFNNETAARVFMDVLAKILNAEKIDWKADYVPLGLSTKIDWTVEE